MAEGRRWRGGGGDKAVLGRRSGRGERGSAGPGGRTGFGAAGAADEGCRGASGAAEFVRGGVWPRAASVGHEERGVCLGCGEESVTVLTVGPTEET